MIYNDGGAGRLKIHYPKRLGIWSTLIENKYDAVLGYRKLTNTKFYSPYFFFHKLATKWHHLILRSKNE